jgi:hypothetical protein
MAEHCVNSIVALKALGAGVVHCLTVLGYYTPGDGGGGSFYWDASATEIDNGGTIIAPTSNPPTGRWKRLVDDHLSVKWFGAIGDGVHHGDTAAIQATINAALEQCYSPKGLRTSLHRLSTSPDPARFKASGRQSDLRYPTLTLVKSYTSKLAMLP